MVLDIMSKMAAGPQPGPQVLRPEIHGDRIIMPDFPEPSCCCLQVLCCAPQNLIPRSVLQVLTPPRTVWTTLKPETGLERARWFSRKVQKTEKYCAHAELMPRMTCLLQLLRFSATADSIRVSFRFLGLLDRLKSLEPM